MRERLARPAAVSRAQKVYAPYSSGYTTPGRAHGGDNGGGVRARAERELVAVGSRSLERGQAFATEHGIPRAHGSYEALAANPEIDAVYIATPHTQHTDIALAVIEAGKALLVEKSFSSTVEDTQRIIDAARARGTFAMEAIGKMKAAAVRLVSVYSMGSAACRGVARAMAVHDPARRAAAGRNLPAPPTRCRSRRWPETGRPVAHHSATDHATAQTNPTVPTSQAERR